MMDEQLNKDIVQQIRQGKIEIFDDADEGIAILLAGDLCPVGSAERACLAGNMTGIYGDLLPEVENKDISIVNLECPLTEARAPILKSGPHLKAHPNCVEILKAGKFDVAALANNHIMDYGWPGLKDTLDVCSRNGIRNVGAGRDLDEAGEILYLECKGIRMAIVNAAEHEFSIAAGQRPGANPLDPVGNYYKIKEAARKAHHVLAVVHAGKEHYPLPDPSLAQMCRFFIDAGASAVIGHHSHCAGGIEIYGGAPILYGLGNFLFDWPTETFEPWFRGFVARLTVSKSSVDAVEIIPYRQFKGRNGLSKLQDEERRQFLNDIADYSKTITDPAMLAGSWRQLARSSKSEYLKHLLNLNKVERLLLKKGVGRSRILKRKKLLKTLNILRCRSHRELAVRVLEDEIGGE